MMKRLRYKVIRMSLETIYIWPLFDYGDILFAGTYHIVLTVLDKVQVEAMSITTGASARSYIQLLFHDTVSPSITK